MMLLVAVWTVKMLRALKPDDVEWIIREMTPNEHPVPFLDVMNVVSVMMLMEVLN